jgi:uncharacterized protein YndB with AHSA1/START domain
MLEVTVVEHFDLDRVRLWDALADLEAHREWMTDVRALRFLTAQRSGVGTRYVIEVASGPVRVRDHIEVVTWNRPGELAITHHIGPARGAGRFCWRPPRGEPAWSGARGSRCRGGRAARLRSG